MKRLVGLFSLIILAVTAGAAIPQELGTQTAGDVVARLVSLQGKIEVRRVGQTQWHAVKAQDLFAAGDVVRAGPRSRADIALVSDTVVRIDQNTTILFSERDKKSFSVVNIIKGAFYFFTNRPRSLKVETPFVNGYVEGTEFYVRVDDNAALFSIFKGRVALSNEKGSLAIGEGQSAETRADRAPEIKVVLQPRDAVKWTLYYPTIIDCPPVDPEHQGPADAKVLSCRASDLLSVGRFDEALPELNKALALTPSYGPALAMQAILALVENDKVKAAALARKAVDADPRSAATWMALSYTRQADFNLAGALESARKAAELDPQSGLALSRVAELRLSGGRLGDALASAQQAVKEDPRQGRNQTVLGFSYLSQIKTKEAMEAFQKAIDLDQSDPMPRLGMGLAVIREGRLAEGREHIEIAASLDPQNSIIRSYLGKAYYEEKREKQAADQFALAKQFDSKDPTPFLYDAILKQSTNKPVEALYDLEKSMELNDQRAVYRSRLLLDEDIAVRSVQLARIHTDLGFAQRALSEGYRSVNTDPANFSAHRFLSDAYTALPRHQIARVSELLQSQLLQPININPVQPSLAQGTNLPLGNTGPADPAFNEYTPLFERNRFAILASGIAGERGTWGDEVIQSGLWDRWSYSVGQLHYQTNGYRPNDYSDSNVYNVFGQMRLSYQTSIQVELQSNTWNHGDVEQRFFSNDYQPYQRTKEYSDSARLGFHHAFTPGSDVIANLVYRRQREDLQNRDPAGPFTYNVDQDGYMGEVQYLWRKERLNIVTGLGYASTDNNESSGAAIPPPPPWYILDTQSSTVDYTNLYLYSQINAPKSLVFTIGASGDFLRGAVVDRNQFNPKFGITWNPWPSTAFRGAVFRTLKRALITNQTVEPTQVAGFNQFYDDSEGTIAWRYGAGVDQKFAKSFYGGMEVSWRDLQVPIQTIPTPAMPFSGVKEFDWRERMARAYLYWTPHPWLAFSAEYLYEQFDRDRIYNAGVEQVSTNRVPVGVSFFHPSGITARLRATYVDQKGLFRPQNVPLTDPNLYGWENFWVVDAALSYRLPKRYGMITAGVKNLFNRSFNYQDMDPLNPTLKPDRMAYVRVTLSF